MEQDKEGEKEKLGMRTWARFLCATAAIAAAHSSHNNSVRPSVCPSHVWISQKRCKLGSPNLHRRLPGRF